MLNLTYTVADQNFATTKSLGILNLSIQLAKALASSRRFNRFTILSNSTIHSDILNAEIQLLNQDFAIANKVTRLLWDQWGVYQAAASIANDWLFLPKGFASFMRRPPSRLAAYVHDAMIEHYRTNYPGRMSGFECWYFRKSLRATIQYADLIFTNSDFTRTEVLRLAKDFGCTPPPIVVAGIGFNASLAHPKTKKNQMVFLASKWPHKLTSLAIDYLDKWQNQTRFDGSIVFVGAMPECSRIPKHARWTQYPRLEEDQFRTIIEESRALIFFSDYEGFGMPPVEAVISGTCPVFSDISATREVMRGTGYPFQNDSYESFADAMDQALHNEETLISQWRETLLTSHRWEKVAQTVTNSLENF